MIKLAVIGNLGKDCTTNQANGNNVINFNVAHTEKWKDAQGNQKEKTIWVECAHWTDKVGIVPYLKKGQQVYVEGTPDVRQWESNGKTGVSLSLRVGLVQLLGSSSGAAPAAAPAASNTSASRAPAEDITEPIDDLPF